VELPHVEKFYRELKSQGFALLTVTQDPPADVRKMIEYNGITHPIVSDTKDAATGNVYKKYHAYDGKHYVIGRDGTILAAFSKLGVSLPILRQATAKYGVESSERSNKESTPAQPAHQPVVWSGTAVPAVISPGARLLVWLNATMDPGWHIYAITQRSGGPTPLRLQVATGQPFAMAGDIKSPAPEVTFDPGFGIDVQTHALHAEFVVPITARAGIPAGKQTLKVEARYQACNGSFCLPAQTITVELPVTVTPGK
jgi:hypothetical protein